MKYQVGLPGLRVEPFRRGRCPDNGPSLRSIACTACRPITNTTTTLKPNLHDPGCEPNDLHVTVSEPMVATAKLAAMRLDGRNVMPAPREVPARDPKPK